MKSSEVYTKPTKMVASRYRSSIGTSVNPNFTSSAGNTPDSLSNIIQPSVRTVSLTQKGMRQMMNNREPARPRASLAMIQATGNASSSVRSVAVTDITAVRTKTCQYRGSVKKVRYCARLATYCLGPVRSRKDSRARSTWGRMIRAPSHSSAGASSRPSARRPCQRRALSILSRRAGARRKAHRPRRVEAEGHLFVGLQVRKLPGLGQGNAEFAPSPRLLQQHRRIRAVEQNALDLARVQRKLGRQFRGAAREHCHFRAHEDLDGIARGDGAAFERAHHPAVGGGDFGECAVGAGGSAHDPVVRTHEGRHERRLRTIVQVLRSTQLLESPVTHHADVIGQHQCFGLIMGDVHEGRTERGLQLLEFYFHVLAQLQI